MRGLQRTSGLCRPRAHPRRHPPPDRGARPSHRVAPGWPPLPQPGPCQAATAVSARSSGPALLDNRKIGSRCGRGAPGGLELKERFEIDGVERWDVNVRDQWVVGPMPTVVLAEEVLMQLLVRP